MKGASLSNPQRCGWVVALLLGLVYLGSIGPHWKIQCDSAMFIGLGESLVEGRGYSFGGLFCAGTPFGWPLLMAGLYRLFGRNFLVMNTVLVLMSLATLWLVYRSIKEMAGAWWGLIVVTLTGLLHVMVEYSVYLMTDMPGMFGFWLGFYFLQRLVLQPAFAWTDVLGASCGLMLACAFRYTSAFAVPLFALAPWLRRWEQPRKFHKNLLLAAVLVLPAVLLLAWWIDFSTKQAVVCYQRAVAIGGSSPVAALPAYITWGDLIGLALRPLAGLWLTAPALMNAALKGLTTFGLEAIRLEDPNYLNPLRIAAYGAAFLILGILVGLGGWRVSKTDRGLSLIAVLIYCASMLVAQRAAVQRYLLPLFPFLLWFIAEGLNLAWERWRPHRGKPEAPATPTGFPLRWPTTVCLIGLLLPNLVNIAREIRQVHRADYYATLEKGAWKDLWAVSEWIRQHAPPEARLFTREFAVMHFWTKRPCVWRFKDTRPGDLLVLEHIPDLRRRFNQWQVEPLKWEQDEARRARALVERGAAREVFRSGAISVYLRGPKGAAQTQSPPRDQGGRS
ncbi:MAG: glycosyltransferase family 39 protein [Verrucomicrobiae bacterium]|nr:glycosyltransferase family 39 protein [Verrucomicrobiae bacterium]